MGEKKKQVGAPHRALYRKYRSRSLEEVIGQEHITKTLSNAIKQGKISHAYLFTGPRGTGKTSVARILAHEINDIPYTDDSISLDIIEIDAASNRRIDDIRDLRDKVHIAPVGAKYKVYIIDEVHMLTTESFNALLKTLEEPPEHVIFILATTEVHKLPATIISRTQRHSFRSIPSEKVAKHLQDIAKNEGFELDDQAAQLLAEYGEGSFRDSISLLDQMSASDEPVTVNLIELLIGLAPQESLEQLLEAAQSGDSKQLLIKLESLIESGLTPAAVANQLLKLLRSKARNESISSQNSQLMHDLLGVAGSQYPQLKLEAILLGVAPKQAEGVVLNTKSSEKSPDATHTPPAHNPEIDSDSHKKPLPPTQTEGDKPKATNKTPTSVQSQHIVEKPETEAPSTNVQDNHKAKPPKKPGSFSIEDDWQGVLDLTKKKNNSLYTVLRLAKPELNGDDLTLYFAFPFHQKKLDEPRYKSIVAEAVNEQTGTSVAITAIVDKDKVNKPSTVDTPAEPKNNANASLISSVQDIMGGGEVVNL